MQTLGERLRKLRLEKNITLEELGEKIGVSHATIFKYETGEITNVKICVIEKLSKIFGVSPVYLVGWGNNNPDLKMVEVDNKDTNYNQKTGERLKELRPSVNMTQGSDFMESQGERLKQLRLNKGLTQTELAELIGVRPPTVQRYESGKISNVKTPVMEKLSEIFGVSPAYIIGCENSVPDIKINNGAKSVPFLNNKCVNDNLWSESNYEGYFTVDHRFMNVDFALRICDKSMSLDGMSNGDVALMKSTSYVKNGRIAAIFLKDSQEVIIRRIFIKDNCALLQPSNTDYEPIVALNYKVLGELTIIYHVL